MKNLKKFSLLLIALLLLSCLAAPAFAEAGLDYITDTADLITAAQWEKLEQKAAAITDKYSIGVYVIAMDDYHNYSDGSDVWEAGMELYNKYNLGLGSDRSSALMVVSTKERDCAVDFYGDRSAYAFTEAGRDRMIDRIAPYLRNNDYYGAFNCYLDTCEEYLAAAADGHPVGEGERSTADEDDSRLGIFSAIPGLIVAAITGSIMSSGMHTARVATNANNYAVQGSLELRRRSDMFLHRSVTRTPRQTSSSSSPSRSSTHHSSGGHSGRSFKY